MISEESKNKIAENNKTISKLLKENEDICEAEGYKTPQHNYSLDRAKRIQFPSDYIRNNHYFMNKYHLYSIVSNSNVRKNIAYTFQLSDMNNFLANRFNIWGSVETMFFKSFVINVISIFEAIIFECANNICCSTSSCNKVKECVHHFTNKERNYSSFEALVKMNNIGITNFSETELDRINGIIGFRNRVHIRLAEENEFNSDDFTLSLCNDLLVFLQRLCDKVYENGVPLYNKCNN